ncbi:MAG: 3-oxoacid CoA-transferase subunit B [Eubacteriales bacterium]|nr:3-oxoacid CoA-transferase subunit B [Eubacteriales bacterium]MDD4541090.1 3-oxoacid CoA-transferase subunit B [Eubacteriales bacterium]
MTINIPIKDIIAKKAAAELFDGAVVNLGIGLPELVANYIPEDVEVILQSENGILGMGPHVTDPAVDHNCFNAGGKCVSLKPGSMLFDTTTSFMFIRGGHVDIAILGALQVDQTGSLASHEIPGKFIPGMGGAMDLAAGAKKLIVATSHTQKGQPKLLEKITFPATAINCVDTIVTELCVIDIVDGRFVVREMSADISKKELEELTAAPLMFNL